MRQLVLQDNVYAIFDGLGTPTHLAVESFLNAQKVPDVFVASGCDCWDQPTTAPETFGWQLDYIREGKILGQYVAQHFKGKKIGYFYQDDEFGMDGVKGLDYEIPKSMVVSRQSYVDTNVNVAPQVAALRAAGAQVVVSFSIPAFTALLKLTSLKLGFSPTLVVSNVGSDPITLSGLLESFAKQGGATVNGNSLTTASSPTATRPSLGSATNSWIALFKKIHDQYDAKAPFDGNVLYGMGVAYTFVQAMLKAGRNPTRADLVNAINAGLPQGPLVAPYAYSMTDHDGVTGAYIGVINNGALTPEGPVLTTDTIRDRRDHLVHRNPARGAGQRHPRALIPADEPSMTTDERPPAERLLAAAEELFGERSYGRTTVADICARAGMATGSFYAYFDSKAEIFAAVVRAINRDLRRAMAMAVSRPTTISGRGSGPASARSSTWCRGGPGSTGSCASPSSSRRGCSASTTSSWPGATPAACASPSSPARSTPATTPRSSPTSTPASATSWGCAGRTGPPADGCPMTCSTTCSSCSPGDSPRPPRSIPAGSAGAAEVEPGSVREN